MSDFRGNKEVARQLILDLKCSVCKDVPGFIGVRKRRYVCSKGKVIARKSALEKTQLSDVLITDNLF